MERLTNKDRVLLDIAYETIKKEGPRKVDKRSGYRTRKTDYYKLHADV